MGAGFVHKYRFQAVDIHLPQSFVAEVIDDAPLSPSIETSCDYDLVENLNAVDMLPTRCVDISIKEDIAPLSPRPLPTNPFFNLGQSKNASSVRNQFKRKKNFLLEILTNQKKRLSIKKQF